MGFLLGDLQLFSQRGSRLAFGFRAIGLSTRRSGDGIFVSFLGSGAKGSEGERRPQLGLLLVLTYFKRYRLVFRTNDSPLRVDEEG